MNTLMVYVNEIFFIRNDKEGNQNMRACLIKEFEINELGKLKYFLEIEVLCSK